MNNNVKAPSHKKLIDSTGCNHRSSEDCSSSIACDGSRHDPQNLDDFTKLNQSTYYGAAPNRMFLKIVTLSEEMVPQYQTEGAAGADLMACIDENIVIQPGRSAVIGTGISLEVPQGYEVQIRSRSGLACRHQVCVLNSPGTIDSDYRGEIKIILMNHGEEPFIVTPKMRIAQMVLSRVSQAQFITVEDLKSTVRGSGGFGHTGT